MCSPFNHLNDFANYGPLPAGSVESGLTWALWQARWAWPLSPSPRSQLEAHQPPCSHTFLLLWIGAAAFQEDHSKGFVYFLCGWLCSAGLSHFQIVKCA